MKNEHMKKGAERGAKTVKDDRTARLLLANAAALLTLLAVTAAVLWWLGLLDSVLASLFPKR